MYLQKKIPDKLKLGSKRFKSDITVLSAYTILSLIFTYPAALSPNKVPGGGDAFWFLWDFWWFKTALFNFASPYYTSYIYYPVGVSLASSTITPLNAAASIPLQLAFGLVGAYKIIWILSFILSGFGTFLLVKYLVGDSRAAFVSGLIFMFCPYHFAHALGHMNLTSMQWIPFYVLFLIKTINGRNRSNAFFAGFFLFLNAISCYYYLIYLSTFTIIYLLYMWRSYDEVQNIETIRKVGIMTVSFVIVFTPFMYPVMKEILNSDSVYYGGFVVYSADLLGFFIPSIFHPIFKDFVAPIYNNFTGNGAEYTVFVGYTVIILSIIAIIKVKIKDIKFWVLSAVIFFVLSLGPILHINGIINIVLDGYSTHIPLPYAILMHIPIFSLARVPSRWTVLLMLSLAVLAGYGLKYLFDLETTKKKNNMNILFIFVICLILFEFLAIPFTMSSAEVPEFYKQISNDGENYAIFEVPNFAHIVTFSDYMYYQSVHEKMIVNGYVSRVPGNVTEFFTNKPIFSHLIYLQPSFEYEDILNQNVTDICPSVLNYYNIRYIVLHEDRMNSDKLSSVNQFLQMSIGAPFLIYENDSIVVYKIKTDSISKNLIMSLGASWHGLEDWGGTPTRWMENDATLIIESEEDRTAVLSFQAISFYRPRTLEMYAGDGLEMREVINASGFAAIKMPVHLKGGTNFIRLHVPEGCERPRDIPQLKNSDERCLSMAFQDVYPYEIEVVNT